MKSKRSLGSIFFAFIAVFSILCLSPSPFCAAAEIGFEAEDADVFVPIMAAFEDPNASGGMFIAAGLKGSGRQAGQAEFNLNVLAAGDYTAWGRVITTGGGTDSLFLTMDEDDSPQAADSDKIWDVGHPHPEWTWIRMNWREDENLAFNLTRGEHKFIVWSREGNTRLDAVYMSTDPNADPKLPADVEQLAEAVEALNKLTTVWGAIKTR